jgi:muramoyltetrapeptide carboxypeptidase LdcA involved in peptidoglycan recycling
MQQPFVQEILNILLFKKIATSFPFLEKDKIEEEEMEKMLTSLEKEGILQAIIKSEQDPKELVEMALVAFDDATQKSRERLKSLLDQSAERISKKK